MANVWSEESRLRKWLEAEIAVCEQWNRLGKIPAKALNRIKRKAVVDIDLMRRIERESQHDVIAFLEMISQRVGEDSRYLHLGITSSDIIDISFARQLVEAADLILKDIDDLLVILKKRALEFKMLPMIGRTHGVHAQPITFGLKISSWYSEFHRQKQRLMSALDDISVGKISGAVGTFANVPPQIEAGVCKKFGLKREAISTQVIPRDRHANLFSTLAGIAASIERVAVEIRNLQRTEIGEVAEPFGRSQKGSSAMPHKRNPILCENLTGLSRLVRSFALAALEDVALWHERDISHSSVERVIAPGATVLVDFMLARLTNIIAGMDVFPKRMLENLKMNRGAIFSERVMLSLVEKGMDRQKAYRIVQGAAFGLLQGKGDLKEILLKNKDVTSKLSPKELGSLFDLQFYFKHVDSIFTRVFG